MIQLNIIYRIDKENNKVSTVKRLYIEMFNGTVDEYKEVDTDIEIDRKVIKRIGSSQILHDTYMPNIINDEETITIEV